MIAGRGIGVAFSLLALSLAAADGALADPPTAYEALHFPDTPSAPMATPLHSAIRAGDLVIRLEQTRLTTVQRRFGGVFHHGGDAGGAVTWLCYARSVAGGGSLAYWFISNDEMGGGTQITQVAVQRLANAADKSCGSAPDRLTGLNFSLPSIGAHVDDVRRRFGDGPSDGYFSYTNSRSAKSANDPDSTVTETLNYHFTDGLADAVSVQQITAD